MSPLRKLGFVKLSSIVATYACEGGGGRLGGSCCCFCFLFCFFYEFLEALSAQLTVPVNLQLEGEQAITLTGFLAGFG
jgi:hypothetical protein